MLILAYCFGTTFWNRCLSCHPFLLQPLLGLRRGLPLVSLMVPVWLAYGPMCDAGTASTSWASAVGAYAVRSSVHLHDRD